MDHRHTQNAVDALLERGTGFAFVQSASLHAQQRGDSLQVVLHPVVYFLEHGRLDAQLVLFLPLLGHVGDAQDDSFELAVLE